MAHIVKVFNFTQSDGRADYKGLNIDLNVAGSQLYPSDANVAYLYNTGYIPEHEDIEIITQEAYNTEKARIEALPKPVTTEDRVTLVEEIIMNAMMGGKL